MSRIIELLKEKNGYLEKFAAENEKQLLHLCDGDYDNLDRFYHARESLLEMIGIADREIDSLLTNLDQSSFSREQKLEVHTLLDNKDEIVKQILAQDLQVISIIESEKSSIIRELQKINQDKGSLRKYKTKTYSRRLAEKA